ncbi:MAG: hypothetical protein ACK5MY_02425 [Jhaorihella sp.]
MPEDIARRHKASLNDTQVAAMAEVQDAVNGLWAIMDEFVPESRHKDLAKDALEIASMLAVKAVTAPMPPQ